MSDAGAPPSPSFDGPTPSPSLPEKKTKKDSSPKNAGNDPGSPDPADESVGSDADDVPDFPSVSDLGDDADDDEKPVLKKKLRALQEIKPCPHESVLKPRKPPALRQYVLSDYTSCIFPTSFFQIIEAGRIFQRATIPYRFIKLLEKNPLDELTDDFFLIFCARNGKEVAGDPSFYETRDPQDLIEGIFNQYDAEGDLLPVASGLNAAIRTYVNWHKHCMMITADYFEHRQQVTKKILIDYHYELKDYNPKQEAQNTIFANRFYSYALSLALARGYVNAYPLSKKTALRGEAKRVDAGKAWTIYTEVETLFLKYVDNSELPKRDESPIDQSSEFSYSDDEQPQSPPKRPFWKQKHFPPTSSGTSDTPSPRPDDADDASYSLTDSPPKFNVDDTDSPSPKTTPKRSPKPKTFLGRYEDILSALDAATGESSAKSPKSVKTLKHCKELLKSKLTTPSERNNFGIYMRLLIKGKIGMTTEEQKRFESLDKHFFGRISSQCIAKIKALLEHPWIPTSNSKVPLGKSPRKEGFAEVDPDDLTDEELTDDDVDAAMAEHMLDGP